MSEALIYIYTLRLPHLVLVALTIAAILYLRSRKRTTFWSNLAFRRATTGMIIAITIGVVVSEFVGAAVERQFIAHITGAIPVYAKFIQNCGHEFLDTDTPLNHPNLKKLREARETWIATNPEIADIYTVRRNQNGTITPILQQEPAAPDIAVPQSENRIAGGGQRPELLGCLDKLFDTGQMTVISPHPDPHGYCVSVFFPLYDTQGRIEAAIGIDAPANNWLLASLNARVLVLCIAAALAFGQLFFALHIIQNSEQGVENQRRNTEAQSLAALVNCMQDGVVSTDFAGIITSWNPAAERIYGYSSEEMIGKSIKILIPEDKLGDGIQISEQIRQRRAMANFETSRIRKDGHRIDVSLSASCITDKTGKAVGICYAIRDITEQKEIAKRMKEYSSELERTNRELKDASDQALAATRTKSEFLANMSHEIRTPMTAILGYSDIIASPDSTQPERAEAAQVIRRNGQHLMSLINDILDISKIEAGRVEPVLTPYSPPRLLSEVLSVMRVQAIERHLSLKINYETPIPDNLNIDPTRIRQIIMNLVANAIKFTENGGVNISVRYRRDENPIMNESGNMSAGTFEISVADTGIGIAEEKMSELFQPFWQADNSMTRRFGGAGLGLTISHRLAQILGGTITVNSNPGKGSIFTLSVHVEEMPGSSLIQPTEAVQHIDKATDEAAASGNQTSPAKPKPLADRRILLVEDGPDNQRLISHLLKTSGATVTVAANGQIGVDLAWEAKRDNSPYDVILMDMQMPIMDGYGATRELRDRGYKGVIIALTAHAMADDRQKCIQAGCDDYSTKPIDKSRLLKLMLEYINGKPEPATT